MYVHRYLYNDMPDWLVGNDYTRRRRRRRLVFANGYSGGVETHMYYERHNVLSLLPGSFVMIMAFVVLGGVV